MEGLAFAWNVERELNVTVGVSGLQRQKPAMLKVSDVPSMCKLYISVALPHAHVGAGLTIARNLGTGNMQVTGSAHIV